MNYNKQTVTFRLEIKTIEMLSKLANSSKKTRSALLEEALQLLFTTPGGAK